jgi:hypothetical protein
MVHHKAGRALGAFGACAVLLVGACSSSKSSSSSSSSSAAESTTAAPAPSGATGGSLSGLTKDQAQALMLSPSDVGAGFTAGTFSTDNTQAQPCGQPNVNAQVPPKVDVGVEADSGTSYAVQEEFSTYADSATNDKAWNLNVAGISCPTGSLADSGTTIPVQINGPTDVSSQVGEGSQALKASLSSSAFPGATVVAVKFATGNVSITVLTLPGADPSKAPDPIALAKQAAAKIAAQGS